jgi:predicted GNAT superfamily acetyltransferase
MKPQPHIEIKRLTAPEQFREAVELQKAIWGFDDVDLLPVRFFIVVTKIGGQAFGAYHGDRMVAFCIAIPGLKRGHETYLHSHMLGVLPDYRNLGLGRLLKLQQREEALAQGVQLIEWTFDPLELKNAYFNIERLGCIVRRYVRNQYGISSSRLQGGLPTDRCTAEWWIATEWVRSAIERRERVRPPVEARISIPNAIARLKMEDPHAARVVQSEASAQFLAYFERGLAVVGFEKSVTAGTYLLGETLAAGLCPAPASPPADADSARGAEPQVSGKQAHED